MTLPWFSAVLRNSQRVRCSQRTRERILALVKEMGYCRNSVASALRSGKTHLIGVAMPSPFLPESAARTGVDRKNQRPRNVHERHRLLLLLRRRRGRGLIPRQMIKRAKLSLCCLTWKYKNRQMPDSLSRGLTNRSAPVAGHPCQLRAGAGPVELRTTSCVESTSRGSTVLPLEVM